MTTSAHSYFETIYKASPKDDVTLKVDKGGVCYKGITQKDLGLSPGESIGSVDSDKCKFLIQGTPFGNIVIFEYYPGSRQGILVSSAPRIPDELLNLGGGEVNESQLRALWKSPFRVEDTWGFKMKQIIEGQVKHGVVLEDFDAKS